MAIITMLLSFIALTISPAICGPIEKASDRFIVNRDVFLDDFIMHKADHDIVDIIIPINQLNFQDSDNNSTQDEDDSVTLFYLEADIKQGGNEYKGLSILKKGKAKKILKNGRDAVSGDKESKDVFFAATDGLYIYDAEKNEAKKYGTITDSLTAITKVDGSDILYVVNDKNELYKVTGKGTIKTLLPDAKNVEDVKCGTGGAVFYMDTAKDIYVLKETRVSKVEGLPASKNYAKLLRPMILMDENKTLAIFNETPYVIYSNGSSEAISDIELKVKPTAYALDVTLIQYFALDKNIYEFNILVIVLTNVLQQLNDFVNDLQFNLTALASKKIV